MPKSPPAPLTVTHPQVAALWHPTKNGDLSAGQVSHGVRVKVWWLGSSCGHEWERAVSAQKATRNGGTSCPKCVRTSLPAAALADYWHPSKNGDTELKSVAGGSSVKFWWFSEECGHEWERSVYSQGLTVGKSEACPVCVRGGRLSASHPRTALLWHRTKNEGSSPNDFGAGSQTKAWWFSKECGHEWYRRISSQTADEAAANICVKCLAAKRRSAYKNNPRAVIPEENSLKATHPLTAALWHPSKNGDSTPLDVTHGMGRETHWLGECGHEWVRTVSAQTSRDGQNPCPQCPKRESIILTHPQTAALWHPTKNGDNHIAETSPGSGLKAHWIDSNCGHEWMAPVYRETQSEGLTVRCLYCSGRALLKGCNDLATTHPTLATEWHPANTKQANTVRAGSGYIATWKCPNEHTYKTPVRHRTGDKQANCGYCAHRNLLPGFNDAATTNPELITEWHPTKNGEQTLADFLPQSRETAWWKNETCGHEWKHRIIARTNGGTCIKCGSSQSEAEKEIKTYIQSLLPEETIESNTRKPLKGLELDIYLPNIHTAFEYNGIYWHSETNKANNQYHKEKQDKAAKNGIKLAQIWEDDWINRPEAVKNLIRNVLNISPAPEQGTRVNISKIQELPARTEHFLRKYSMNDSYNYGATEYELTITTPNGDIQAAMLLHINTDRATIKNFTTVLNPTETLPILTRTLSQTFPHLTRAEIIEDKCHGSAHTYAGAGYVESEVELPKSSYRKESVASKSEPYLEDHFKSIPGLKYVEGVNLDELHFLNRFHKVWDAGQSTWVAFLANR